MLMLLSVCFAAILIQYERCQGRYFHIPDEQVLQPQLKS